MLLPGCFFFYNNGSGWFFIFLCLRHGSLCLTGIFTVPFFLDKGHKGVFTKNSTDNSNLLICYFKWGMSQNDLPQLPPCCPDSTAVEEKANRGRLPTCEITTIDLPENAFPLCLHALLSRYSSITGGRRPGSADRSQPRQLRVVIRAGSSFSKQISISQTVVRRRLFTMTSTTISPPSAQVE